jgi:hypothetical protein
MVACSPDTRAETACTPRASGVSIKGGQDYYFRQTGRRRRRRTGLAIGLLVICAVAVGGMIAAPAFPASDSTTFASPKDYPRVGDLLARLRA